MLFPAGPAVAAADPSVVCPLGRIVTLVSDGAMVVGAHPAKDARRLASGALVYSYQAGKFEAEVLVGELSPRLPDGMTVTRCVASVWRVRANVLLPDLAFTCRCIGLPEDADGGPSSGECLDALTWDWRGWMLSIGTEDGEALRWRAGRGENMPSSLVEQLYLGTVEYTPDGLRLPLKGVPPAVVVQVQFLAAWEDKASHDSVSTWFAVEQDSAFVVTQLMTATGRHGVAPDD